jgi:hypothetical protein
MEPYQEDLAIIAKLRQDMADNADVMRVWSLPNAR